MKGSKNSKNGAFSTPLDAHAAYFVYAHILFCIYCVCCVCVVWTVCVVCVYMVSCVCVCVFIAAEFFFAGSNPSANLYFLKKPPKLLS